MFVDADGTGSVSVAASGSTSRYGEQAFVTDVVDALGVGEPVGLPVREAELDSDPLVIQIDRVERDRATVDLGVVRDVMDDHGSPGDATVFVSLCTAATSGRASGERLESTHFESCVTAWLGDRSDRRTATIEFGGRRPPWTTVAVCAVLVASLGVLLGRVRAVSRRPLRRRLTLVGAIGSIGLSLIVAGRGAAMGLASDPWSGTGQTFDQSVRVGYCVVALAGLAGGVGLPIWLLLRSRGRSGSIRSAVTTRDRGGIGR